MSLRARSTWLIGLVTLAVTGGAPAAVRAAPPGPAGGQAVASVTDATTGRADATALAPRAVCPPAGPGRATCYAQALALRSTRIYVHPSLRTPASPDRFFPRGPHTAGAATPDDAAGATATPAVTGSAPPQPGTPAYLQQAYDLGYLSQTQGDGDTVAVVDAFDDPT